MLFVKVVPVVDSSVSMSYGRLIRLRSVWLVVAEFLASGSVMGMRSIAASYRCLSPYRHECLVCGALKESTRKQIRVGSRTHVETP